MLTAHRNAGGYADCYATGIDRPVSHAEYVEAFYTTWLFKLERLVLKFDFRAKTRSWLMVANEMRDGAQVTRLYFGTGIVPVTDKNTGAKSLSLEFRALLGFHKLYSRALLKAARSRLSRR